MQLKKIHKIEYVRHENKKEYIFVNKELNSTICVSKYNNAFAYPN